MHGVPKTPDNAWGSKNLQKPPKTPDNSSKTLFKKCSKLFLGGL